MVLDETTFIMFRVTTKHKSISYFALRIFSCAFVQEEKNKNKKVKNRIKGKKKAYKGTKNEKASALQGF